MVSPVAAENFDPAYVKINPNGTIPSLVVVSDNKILTDSQDILKFLDSHAAPNGSPRLTPSESKIGLVVDRLIELVHSDEMDSNTVLLGVRNEAELESKKAGILNEYITNRQVALEKFSSAEPENAFYSNRLKQNGAIYRIYSASPSTDHTAFFQETEAKLKKLIAALDTLNTEIRLPYAAGEQVTLADLHIVPWLSHVLLFVGTIDPADFSKLDAYLQKTAPGFRVGENIRTWWNNFRERDSFKEVFAKLR